MKLNEFSLDKALAELGGDGAMALPTAPLGQQPGQAAVGVDPMAAKKAQAMAVKQMQDKRKEIQDAIKTKQAEIQDLQKQLASLK
jgi:hypothetical protein